MALLRNALGIFTMILLFAQVRLENPSTLNMSMIRKTFSFSKADRQYRIALAMNMGQFYVGFPLGSVDFVFGIYDMSDLVPSRYPVAFK